MFFSPVAGNPLRILLAPMTYCHSVRSCLSVLCCDHGVLHLRPLHHNCNCGSCTEYRALTESCFGSNSGSDRPSSACLLSRSDSDGPVPSNLRHCCIACCGIDQSVLLRYRLATSVYLEVCCGVCMEIPRFHPLNLTQLAVRFTQSVSEV